VTPPTSKGKGAPKSGNGKGSAKSPNSGKGKGGDKSPKGPGKGMKGMMGKKGAKNMAPKGPKGPGKGMMGMMGMKGSGKGKGKGKGMANKGSRPPTSPAPVPQPTQPPIRPPTQAPFQAQTQAPFQAQTQPPTRPPTLSPTTSAVTIASVVAQDPDLTTLNAALVRAGFVETLSRPGNFTLFAPINSAFEAIPDGLVQLLFENNEFLPHLRNFLLYHLLNGGRPAGSFTNGTVLTTFNTERVRILQDAFRVNGIPVVTPDNVATNGIVHTLVGVLAPSWVFNTIATRVDSDDDLSILLEFLVLAGLGDPLNAFGDAFTLLAPTNAAFEALPDGVLVALRDPANQGDLIRILLYHVLIGVFTVPAFSNGQQLLTIESGFVSLTVGTPTSAGPNIQFNDANGVQFDILATNGVVHKIDAVLDPNQGR
jgi:transforming growth factor-beta-induced protein